MPKVFLPVCSCRLWGLSMFDNILYQNQTIDQLKTDIISGLLAPSILFSGPEYSAKGTAALELARVLCCEDETSQGRWNCICPSCIRHRNLVSPDMLLLGRRRFFEEITASSDAFLRNAENQGSKMLFIRSVRKLLARFNTVLWEDDPKLGKIKNQIAALEEELEDVENMPIKAEVKEKNNTSAPKSAGKNEELEKKCNSIIRKASKLEEEGIGELIPIAHIRQAAYWSRLAPLGKHKCIIMENAEKMQEGAKNSLLKILEEPPLHLSIILTSSRPVSLLPTMLSRLREYRFAKRSADAEAEVISRIFRRSYENSAVKTASLELYLASFLPVGNNTLFPLAAFFAASAAAEAVRERRAKGRGIPPVLIQFGKFATHIAEEGGMGRPLGNAKKTIEKILGSAEGFEIPGLFTRFLQQCAVFISQWLRGGGTEGAEKYMWADLWRKELNRSMIEKESFNINPLMAMERLFEALKSGMA